MALWSRKPPAQPAAPVPASPPPAPVAPPITASAPAPEPTPEPAPSITPAPRPPSELSAEELNRRRTLSKHISATFGEIVTMLMKQPASRTHPLADLEWMVVPALMANQFSVAEAQSKAQGFTAPVALILWARVSAEVDQRLSAAPEQAIKLQPAEWTSGDILWLVEAIGEPRAVQALLQRLGKTKWAGQNVKFRNRDASGKVVIGTIVGATGGVA